MASGGYRVGAGRPAGSLNKTTIEHSKRLSDIAKVYAEDALATLVDVAKNGRTDAARVAAASALLDRAYGKPVPKREAETTELPPLVIQVSDTD